MKAIVIDDEINSRELLHNMLNHYCSGVTVAGMAADVPQGIALIRAVEPDIVFLDIEMPGGDGFAVLDAFPEPGFRVVFVTGYPGHQFADMDLAALAWLQKPVDVQELQDVLDRSGLLPPTSPTQLEWLQAQPEVQETSELLLPVGNGYERIPFAEIAYLAAQRAYASFHLVNGMERLASFPLSHYEKILPGRQFFRVHKSYLVNMNLVKSYEGGRGGILHLTNDQRLPIAARRKADFIKFLKDLGHAS